jgi:hypothetical protein
LPHFARADHEHRGRRPVACDEPVERADLVRGAGDHHYGFRADLRVRKSGLQLAALPQTDDAQPRPLAQPRLSHADARQQRVANRQFGYPDGAERADHVGLGATGVHAVGQ